MITFRKQSNVKIDLKKEVLEFNESTKFELSLGISGFVKKMLKKLLNLFF